MKRLALISLLLLMPSLASAAPFEIDTTLRMAAHTDGVLASPWYGLRLDGLDGSEVGHDNNEWTFDFSDPRSAMTFHYDSELERIMIQGTTWGGQDVGTTYGDTGRLWELSFVYDGVVDHGDYVEVAAGGSNTGMLRDTVNNVEYNLVDFAGNNDHTFRCVAEHRGAPRSCFGWMNHSGSVGGIDEHVYSSDFLFKLDEAPIPEPSAALLFGLGSVLCGSAVRRNKA